MKKVKVIKEVCISYNGKAHKKGDVFEVDKLHYDSFMEQGIIEDYNDKNSVEIVDKPIKKSRKKK